MAAETPVKRQLKRSFTRAPIADVPRFALSAADTTDLSGVPSFPCGASQRPLPAQAELLQPAKRANSGISATPLGTPVRRLRVSWSGLTQSQESLADCGSPRSPSMRTRACPSPPRRAPPVSRRGGHSMEVDDDVARGILNATPEPNEGRFVREFDQVCLIGEGNFSTVYRARNKLDGHDYAVKKTIRISRGAAQTELNEIFALATMAAAEAGSMNIVRYFSSWLEDDRLHIQTELCKCSLRRLMVQRKKRQPLEPHFSEKEMLQVLRDVASGLAGLHARAYVHMDIKPDNILLSQATTPAGESIYKIADFGLATAAMKGKCDDISEGDCRYLSREVMKGDLSELPKADVFSLGLVCYELLINPRELPANGDEWGAIRDGRLLVAHLPTTDSLDLLVSMVRPKPQERPTCADISCHPCVSLVDSVLQRERLQRLEAEQAAKKNRELASDYYQEMLFLKTQQLLRADVPVESAASMVSRSQEPRPITGGRPIASPSLRRTEPQLRRVATM